MWSKNLFVVASRNSYLRSNIRAICYSNRLRSGQVQQTATRVKEYTDTPKPAKQRVLRKFKEPFPKCFFVGKCDPEVLEYPEVLTNEEVSKANDLAARVKAVFHNEIDSQAIDEQGAIPRSAIQKLAELRLCGAKMPEAYDGLGLSETEAMVLNVATAWDGSLSKFICEQQNVCAAFINSNGTEQQKERYLVPLIKGERVIACAYQENTSLADSVEAMVTVALPDGEGGFELTGSKTWVYNAAVADTLIVFANTTNKTTDGQREQALTAFLVPRTAPGVTIRPPSNTFGLRGISISQVDLTEVRVGADAVLGEQHGGLNMVMACLSAKMNVAPLVVGVSQHVLDHVTKHVIKTSFMGARMEQLEGVQARLGRLATAIYTLESAAFLQAGHADLYENPDITLEAFMLKVLASSTLQFVLAESIQLLGPEALAKNEFGFLSRLLRDSAFYSVCDETDLNIKTAVALNGLQHAGLAVHNEVRKIRNPMMYPVFMMKKLFESQTSGNADLGLAGYLHPSLQDCAAVLEECISCVRSSAERLLVRYGKEIVDKHMELHTLADIAITTYALTAVLGRASRSYCIGLAESETEMEMAIAVANESRRRIAHLKQLIDDGPLLNNTTKFITIAQRVLANKGPCTQPPIARNF